MKKTIIMLLLLLSVFMFSSCAKKEVQKKVIITFATQRTSDFGLVTFANRLKEISDGNMTVEFLQMTKFGTMEETIQSMADGMFDVAAVGYTEVRFVVPRVGTLGLVVKDFNHMVRIMNSPLGQELIAEMYEAGIVASPPWYLGTRRTTSNRPINSVADFKGLKMRTTPTGTNFASKMGADVYPIAFLELPKALADGIVDAQENPISLIEENKLYQWQTHLAFTEHSVSSFGVFISRAKYDSFTPEQQMWYNEAIAYALNASNEKIWEEENTLLEKFVNEYGMTITYPDLDEIQEIMKSDFTESIELYGQEFIDRLKAIE